MAPGTCRKVTAPAAASLGASSASSAAASSPLSSFSKIIIIKLSYRKISCFFPFSPQNMFLEEVSKGKFFIFGDQKKPTIPILGRYLQMFCLHLFYFLFISISLSPQHFYFAFCLAQQPYPPGQPCRSALSSCSSSIKVALPRRDFFFWPGYF